MMQEFVIVIRSEIVKVKAKTVESALKKHKGDPKKIICCFKRIDHCSNPDGIMLCIKNRPRQRA